MRYGTQKVILVGHQFRSFIWNPDSKMATCGQLIERNLTL